MNETYLRVVALPQRVRAVVALDENGDYNIYVNTRLSYDERLRAYEHERSHILAAHFYTDHPAAVCESEIAAIEKKKRKSRV